MTEKLKTIGNKAVQIKDETVKRLSTETSPYFKPFKYVGGVMLIAAAGIKVAAYFTPAAPVALASDLLQIGLPLFGVSVLTNKEGAENNSKNIRDILKKLIK